MSLFQQPPTSQYELRFNIARIPVRVHPSFWLLAILFGIGFGSLLITPIWVFVIFVSILIHELGHALAFRRYGQGSYIVLYAMGGLTIPESVPWGGRWANVALSRWQEIFVSLAGPFAGFLFAGLIIGIVVLTGGSVSVFKLLGFIPLPLSSSVPYGGWLVGELVHQFLWVNIFWGLINLMPVQPLDGGNVARNLFIQYDPMDGVRKALWLSVISGALIALVGLIAFRSLYMALLFGFLAYQSYQSVQGRYGRF